MENYLVSFVSVWFVFMFAYGVMKTISDSAKGNKKKESIRFAIFFAICALFYTMTLNNREKKDEDISCYLKKIQESTHKIYDELEGISLLNYIEGDLSDIYIYTEEIYDIIYN